MITRRTFERILACATAGLAVYVAFCGDVWPQDRLTLLHADGTSITWSGAVYGPQDGLWDVIYTDADNDTLFIDAFEPASASPADGVWWLQTWYEPSGTCSPTCERTYAVGCPVWSTHGRVVANCRTSPP